MTRPGKRDAEHTAARRAVARKHHPDVGGDPDVYAAELVAVERRYSNQPPTAYRRESVVKRRARAVIRAVTARRKKNYFDI
ncbi:hypothetical protein QMK17_10035 [Rhodococcus sp. G-MC3]|uniref:hypothetical protein n=1 Tax=Rhodococcus sp. G-MC3 TaxID=3046209 RepID=UPI0024B967B9|nr:hypothetical protein [Rhodococcus sp. G-MC3]MDJ0393668.1 hypothetical protein [Rhodococcus sp. G-MC3]